MLPPASTDLVVAPVRVSLLQLLGLDRLGHLWAREGALRLLAARTLAMRPCGGDGGASVTTRQDASPLSLTCAASRCSRRHRRTSRRRRAKAGPCSPMVDARPEVSAAMVRPTWPVGVGDRAIVSTCAGSRFRFKSGSSPPPPPALPAPPPLPPTDRLSMDCHAASMFPGASCAAVHTSTQHTNQD